MGPSVLPPDGEPRLPLPSGTALPFWRLTSPVEAPFFSTAPRAPTRKPSKLIADTVGAYEAKRWPDGKVPRGSSHAQMSQTLGVARKQPALVRGESQPPAMANFDSRRTSSPSPFQGRHHHYEPDDTAR